MLPFLNASIYLTGTLFPLAAPWMLALLDTVA